MSKVAFDIPSDIKEIMLRHSEINWNKIISDALWTYTKKIRLLDSITAKSKLTEQDVETLDHEIKADLLKRYKGDG